MIVSTKAIVLSSIKYGDNNLIVKCFTEEDGAKSYMLRGVLSSKKGKIKAAYFQPLTQLKIVAKHNNKGNLNSISEVEVVNHYKTVFSNINKQSIVFFLSEVLSFSIQEEEQNLGLYEYLETALIWLDTHDKIANFHLLFLLSFSKYLGFYPETNQIESSYFDLIEGEFTDIRPRFDFVSGNELFEFKKLLGTTFDTLDKVQFSAQNRQQILTILIRYFELHLNGFRKPKSLEILKVIFQ